MQIKLYYFGPTRWSVSLGRSREACGGTGGGGRPEIEKGRRRGRVRGPGGAEGRREEPRVCASVKMGVHTSLVWEQGVSFTAVARCHCFRLKHSLLLTPGPSVSPISLSTE